MKKREYNLPAKMSLETAIVINVIFVFTPSWVSLPVSQLFGTIVIIYYAFFSMKVHENELGLSLKMSKDAITVIIAFVVITLVGLVGIALIFDCFKTYALYDLESISEISQLEYGTIGVLGEIDNLIFPMLAIRQLLPVLALSLNPLLFGIVFASLFESIICFGILFPVIFRRYGYWRALLISAVVFTAWHPDVFTDVFALIPIFTLAIVFSRLYVETRSLYPTIVLHACWNFTIYIFVTMYNWGMLQPPVP